MCPLYCAQVLTPDLHLRGSTYVWVGAGRGSGNMEALLYLLMAALPCYVCQNFCNVLDISSGGRGDRSWVPWKMLTSRHVGLVSGYVHGGI